MHFLIVHLATISIQFGAGNQMMLISQAAMSQAVLLAFQPQVLLPHKPLSLLCQQLPRAITTKDTARAMFGYKMNRLESTISVINNQTENLMAAESRISDVDVATEMATMTRNTGTWHKPVSRC